MRTFVTSELILPRDHRRMLVRIWIAAFAAFTLRSLFAGPDHLLRQAAQRATLMIVGAALCLVLYWIFRVSEKHRPSIRDMIVGMSMLALGLVYATIYYGLIYPAPATWAQTQQTMSFVVQYFVGTIWLFALWAALLKFKADEARRAEPPAASADLWVSCRGVRVRVPPEQLRWVQSDGDYVRLHLNDGNYYHRAKLSQLEADLRAHAFERIHRQILVKRSEIVQLQRSSGGRRFVILSDGIRLPVGRTYLHRLQSRR